MNETRTVYMCSTDFDTELGIGSGHAEVFKALDRLKNKKYCTHDAADDTDCGIYEVEMRVVRVVKEAKF